MFQSGDEKRLNLYEIRGKANLKQANSNRIFTITKDYEENLRNKIAAFKAETQTRNAVHLVMLTTFGVKKNKYSEIAQKELTIDCLFS